MHKFEELLDQLRLDPTNPELKKKIHKWIRQTPDDPQIREILEKHWRLLGTDLSESDLDRIDLLLEKIHWRIKKKTVPDRMLRIGKRTGTGILKIAAVLIFPVLVYTAIQYYQKANNTEGPKELVVQKTNGESRHFLLPDGTEVWLNSGSQIHYSQKTDKAKRRMVSLSGQAYFKVHHDAAHPFIVQTPQMDIRVLGTSFDVSAYPDDRVISSTLEEGSIALLDKKGNQLGKLVPGEQAVFNTENLNLTKTRVKTDDFTSWRSGKLVFRDTGIAEVAKKLERRFGCTITVSPELLSDNPTYTFSIQQETLEEICRLIELSTNAKATIDGLDIQIKK